MPRYATPIEESIGMEIYDRYVQYCTMPEVKAIPDPFSFFDVVLSKEYPITRGGFAYWLRRLQIPPRAGEQPYIWRDPVTHAWRLRDVDVQKIST